MIRRRGDQRPDNFGDEEITTSIFLLSAPSWWTPEDYV